MEGSPALADMYTMIPIILLRPAGQPVGKREGDISRVTHDGAGGCGVEPLPLGGGDRRPTATHPLPVGSFH